MFADRIAMITGASSGIGAACARTFADSGARLILCARRGDRLKELAAQLETEVLAIELDVRDHQSVAAAVEGLEPGWREVSVLVNNAGLAAGMEPLQHGDPDDWERMIDTNIKGLLWVTQAVVQGMISRGVGHVINIGSIAGRETYPSGTVYCASKAAVDRITQGLRMDLLGTGVKVSTVDPGMVDTEFSLVRFHGDSERAKSVYEGMHPLSADDIAESVYWVASRPGHVQVTDLVIFPTDQVSATRVHRS